MHKIGFHFPTSSEQAVECLFEPARIIHMLLSRDQKPTYGTEHNH